MDDRIPYCLRLLIAGIVLAFLIGWLLAATAGCTRIEPARSEARRTVTVTDATGTTTTTAESVTGTGSGVTAVRRDAPSVDTTAPTARLNGMNATGGGMDLSGGRLATNPLLWIGGLTLVGGLVAALVFKMPFGWGLALAGGGVAAAGYALASVPWWAWALLVGAAVVWFVVQAAMDKRVRDKAARYGVALDKIVHGVDAAPQQARKAVTGSIEAVAGSADNTVRAVVAEIK